MSGSPPRGAAVAHKNAAGDSPSSVQADFPIVGVGASAGGLDAYGKLLDALPARTGMAFILVQHLDPTHQSLMVDLLARRTRMPLRQAVDGMRIEPDHLYVIAPGTYLSVDAGVLRVSEPQARHGARLPFDFLLRSLAAARGERAIGVILSGAGADGSLGAAAVRAADGLVLAQDPDQAGYDGMPRSAIAAGVVDEVLSIEGIVAALSAFQPKPPAKGARAPWLPAVIDLLREKTPHDFRLYKPGTLQRRIEQRMTLAGIAADDAARYLDLLRRDPHELDLLGNDLLINVTSFFRDPKVFDLLSDKIIPDLVRDHAQNEPLRVWIAGCSTGEEAYSLAMLFSERIAAAQRDIRLQVFASDVDPKAVAHAREGLYPDKVQTQVSPARLARFFTREDFGYRVSPDLRESVTFTVQDVLNDPPFSRLDFISCRNLLIYVQPEAQANILAHLHFALRDGGVLLLGGAEAVGSLDGPFEVISKADRLYRRAGRDRPRLFDRETRARVGAAAASSLGRSPRGAGRDAMAELCRQLLTDGYAPAAVLINQKQECLYFSGSTDRYLRVAAGAPTHDLLAMAHKDMRTKLRAALQRASQEDKRVVVSGAAIGHDDATLRFSIAAQPVRLDGEPLTLVCFLDEVPPNSATPEADPPQDVPRIAALEQELETTRGELQGAIRNLEISSEEQKAINDEYLSVNEELLTSKEELQSLNEELTALNGQLQETLDRQRTTANDLQNVLYSTDVATLFLDRRLHIRFSTPATKALFGVLPTDVGRPLSDLSLLGADRDLAEDAHSVIETHQPVDREIETQARAWFVRRISPYRTHDNRIEGVVVTFTDISERKRAAKGWEEAKQQAERANIAKSRFLAAASHDLRQPLQTLALLHGLLAKDVVGEKSQTLVARLDETLDAMSGMLNALLDINQIEAGAVNIDMLDFQLDELLDRLNGEFGYHAHAQGLTLRTVRCTALVHSDPRLVEQMLRNLLSNALKYTSHGRILLSCRRRHDGITVEIWDTGIGIPDGELQAIFGEYHQLNNDARERSRGLGLGLSIVQRLADLLGHRVEVRSALDKGSVFGIELPLAIARAEAPMRQHRGADHDEGAGRVGDVLVIEDDPEVRDLLEQLLVADGHYVSTAVDGVDALERTAGGALRPDVILADYNLPRGLDGLQTALKLRDMLRRPVPVAILTGDISTETLRRITRYDCQRFNKPINAKALTEVIQALLPEPRDGTPAPQAPEPSQAPIIYVVDDDAGVRGAICSVLEDDGRAVEAFETGEAFLDAYRPGRPACILIDAHLPGMDGLELLQHLTDSGRCPPAIMITGHSDVSMAVRAMKAGAVDFIEKPIGRGELLAGIDRALEQGRDAGKLTAWRQAAAKRLVGLTQRQRQIMALVLAGQPSKNIAADLNISQRTVENHRASIMKRSGCASLPALARLALAAADAGPETEAPTGPERDAFSVGPIAPR
jgi:two-component system CheB/CheR fusion protein